MGLFSSIFGKKKKTTQTSTSTTTPNIPSWITDAAQGLSGQITALGSKDPYSFVAPASDLQTQAWTQAKDLGSGPDYLNAGANFMAAAGTADAPSYRAQTYRADGYSGEGYTGQGYTGEGYQGQGYQGQGYDAATGTAQSLLTNLDSYMSPYRKQVVDTTLADLDYAAGKQKAEDDLAIAAAGAFGGSGAALTKSMTAENLYRARGSTEANLLDTMFGRGAALSADDSNRRQQMEIANMDAINRAREFTAGSKNTADQFTAGARNAADQFSAGARNAANQFTAGERNTADQFSAGARNTANQFNAGATNSAREFNAGATNTARRDNAGFENQALERLLNAGKGLVDTQTAAGTDERANLELLNKLGADQRAVQQDYLNAPLNLLGFQTGQFQNLPTALFAGQTTNSSGKTTQTSSPSPFDAAVQAAKIAAMFMGSDERLKKDIVRIGTLPNGLGLYEYEYIWGGGRRTGVMAQEVQQIQPEAVGEFAGGFLAVNYGALR